ncbi:UNVERIFIED_CONTAM: hypothetical protein FKN15_014852 [Acipenser sinensis]
MSSCLYYVVPVLGGYALTSVVLFKNPHLLHRKKQTAFYSRHISHRGGHYSTGTDRQIALLEHVFQKFPNVPVNLEIKEDNEALIKKLHLFVLNEESEFRKAFDLGATGVMTDYPTKLRRYLDNNPPPEPSNH